MNNIRCPSCNSKKTIKKGIRKRAINRFQQYQCNKCKNIFLDKKFLYNTYPEVIVYTALNHYNLGNSLADTSKIINRKYRVNIGKTTIYSWIKKYQHITPILSIRKRFLRNENDVLFYNVFKHENLEYKFMYHKYKLDFYGRKYYGLVQYIKGFERGCPDIFFELGERCSQPRFKVNVEIKSKINLACEMAGFASKVAKINRDRHDLVEEFMLINDKASVACEIPVWYWEKSIDSGITGHIDILQIRDKIVYILDYKPGASSDKKAIQQLYNYAVAIAFRAKIPFEKIMCAWFDENNYYEYRPADADVSLIR